MRLPLASSALALCVALASASAGAQAPPPGRLLASGCFQCHGTNGVISSGFGTLAGVSAKDMMSKLDDMRRKAPRSSIMTPHARGYTTEQLQSIAKYFAAQPKP